MTDRYSYTSRYKQYIASRRKQSPANDGVFGMGETGLASTGDAQLKQQDSSLERRRSSVRNIGSPQDSCRGTSSVKSGHSLYKMACEKRARRVRFYRNGDRFFKGMIYAVSTERFRTFESLLSALTSSALCDSRAMPNGVRQIFTVDGLHRIESMDQLQEGESYVCASTDVFRNLDYSKNEDPAWNAHLFHHHGLHNHQNYQSKSEPLSTYTPPKSQHRPRYSQDRPKSSRSAKLTKSELSPAERREYEEHQRSFVVPRLITVIRNGKRPRKAVRLLLNKKTAQTMGQVMADITDAVKLDCGSVKKLFALSGIQVTCLADFFQNDTVFLACGHEKITEQDFDLDKREVRQVSAYRPFSKRARERITLKKCPEVSQSVSKCSDHMSVVSQSTDKDSQKHEKGDAPQLAWEEKLINKEKFDISQVAVPVALSNKYEIGNLIGTGNFAVVLECNDKKTNRKYALKIINKEYCKGKEKMIDNEVRILRCVKHPNIIRLLEDYTNQHQLFYIMELVKGGDLFDAIASSTKYTEQDAGGMLYNLASALEYLHSLHIVHRDVKPENILIRQHDDRTKSLKLGDFGLATEVKGPLYTVCGTPTYVAPEVIAETGYGLKIDVWSAGVIAYILLCGFPPFSSPSDNQDELFDMIITGNYDFPSPYWDDVTDSAKNVISGMLEIDPDARMTATQVLEHKWVASDTKYEADLQKRVSMGLGTYFRRGPKSTNKYAGIKIMATTALDKTSRFFQGRSAPYDKDRGKEE